MNKYKILIDCDPGHDDAIMLLIAALNDSFDIIGVSSCSGNQTVEKTALNASNLLHYFNREDIPIAIGSPTPILRPTRVCAEIHGESGLDGFIFPKYNHQYVPESGCDFIINKLLENKEVIVIATGPLTNVGMAIKKNPSICSHIKEIVLMGGSTTDGNITKEAEFNILVDPEAADICFRCDVPIRMFGLNVTRQVLVTKEVIDEARKIDTRGGKLFVDLMEVFNKNQHDYFDLDAGPLHDPCTIISLIDESVFDLEPMNVTIDTSFGDRAGKTICSKTKPYNAMVAVNVNINKYWKIVYDHLRKCI